MAVPRPLQEGIPADAPSSRRNEAAAGWYDPGEKPPLGDWQSDLGKRRFPKWDTFSWLSVRTLLESANDAIAKRAPTIIRDRRRRYVAAQRTAGAERADHGPPTPGLGSFGPDFVVDWTGLKRPRFLLVGDPGEADASQYATIAPLLEVHRGGPAWEGCGLGKSDFMVVLSDVIYPAGDVNDYVNGFYIPFRPYDRPIHAIPGNHDWYDGLSGFMFHHCGAEPLATLRLANIRRRPGERLLRALWQRASKPDRDLLAPYMQQRARLNLLRFGDVDPDPHAQRRPVQPAPYFAIELDELFLVAIDTGVAGELDAEQGEWLLRISARPKPKVLLTGKPIWVNNEYRRGEIVWGDERRSCTVDDIVRHPPHGYVAAIGGDTHNFQRYPVRVGERTIQYIVAGGSGAFLSLTHPIPRVGPTAEHDLPAGEDIGFDEDDFRCYPLRGDSLRLACRRIGPFLFKSLATLLLVAAAAALLFFLLIDIDADRRLAAGLSALGVAGLLLAGLAVQWVWRRTSPGRKAPLLPLALVATAGVVTVLLALADRRATVAVAVALAVPLAAVLGILVAYAGRGRLPASGSGWLLVPPVLALAPALWAPYSLGPVADSLLYGLAPLLAAILLVRLVGTRAKDAGTGRSTGIYRALVTVTWLALAAAVVARFGEAWMGRSLALVLALLLLIAYLVPRLAPGELRAHPGRPDRFGPAASAALQVSIAGLALVALDALAGDDAAAATAEGIAAVIGVLGALAAACLLVVCRLNPRTLWWLRTGEMTPAGAARFVGRQICVAPTRAGEPTPSDRKRRKMAGVVWRWRLHASEIADTNAAPFFKSFLSVEVHPDWLEISCWGVSGYRDPGRSPSLEDRIAISLAPLAPAGPAPGSADGAPVVAAPLPVMGGAPAPGEARSVLAPEASSTREEVTFRSEGVDCAAWHYRPVGREPAPCVVLAHGFDGVRDQALGAYAERFVAAGLAAFVFDYRYFGDSKGSPRQQVKNSAQLEDWRAAIACARGLDGVDERRIALWGTSTSGGHVVKVGAEDAGIAAVVCQMPFASGFAQFNSMPVTQSLRLVWAGLRDQVRAWIGAKPLKVPAVGRPHSLAVTTTRDAVSGLARITPQGSTWRNEVLARFALRTTFYSPGRAAKRLCCPLLVCIADGDRVMPAKPALKMAEHGTLRRYGFGHFAMYYGEGFERAVADQVKFLRWHLLEKPSRADGSR